MAATNCGMESYPTRRSFESCFIFFDGIYYKAGSFVRRLCEFTTFLTALPRLSLIIDGSTSRLPRTTDVTSTGDRWRSLGRPAAHRFRGSSPTTSLSWLFFVGGKTDMAHPSDPTAPTKHGGLVQKTNTQQRSRERGVGWHEAHLHPLAPELQR